MVSNSKVNIPIWPKFEFVRDFVPVQVICRSHKAQIKTKKTMLRKSSNMVFFGTKGQVTPKWIIQSGPNSKYSVSLWLFSLPASLTKIWFKMKSLSSKQYFPHYKSVGAIGCVETRVLIQSAQKSYAAFPHVLLIRNFAEDRIKAEGAINLITFCHKKRMGWIFFLSLKGQFLQSEFSNLAQTRTSLRFYACPGYLQVCWRSDKNEHAIDRTSQIWAFVALKGK